MGWLLRKGPRMTSGQWLQGRRPGKGSSHPSQIQPGGLQAVAVCMACAWHVHGGVVRIPSPGEVILACHVPRACQVGSWPLDTPWGGDWSPP